MDIEISRVEAKQMPITVLQNTSLLHSLDLEFKKSLRLSSDLSKLIQNLENKSLQYCVFGGWVRDQIYNLESDVFVGGPRDIDLVVQGIETQDLLAYAPLNVRSTIFGGIQSLSSPIPFDLWPLHETFLIKHFNKEPTFANLLKSTDFNINSALFFPEQGQERSKVLDGGMLEALGGHSLAFNCSSLPFPTIQCGRLAAYAVKFSLKLAPSVRLFMLEVISDPVKLEDVFFGLVKTYPPSISKRAQNLLLQLKRELS